MKLNIVDILLKNKLGLLLILVISSAFSYYGYSVEDKVEIYKAKLSLPKQTNLNYALNNNLTVAKQIYDSREGNCNINLNTEEGTSIEISISVKTNNSADERKKILYRSLLKCEGIIKLALESYIAFFDDLIDFIDRNITEKDESRDAILEKISLKKQKYFLLYVLENFSVEKLNPNKIYAPAKFDQHLINGFITLIILLAVYIGILITNNNILVKKK